jgi:hypothetical protein
MPKYFATEKTKPEKVYEDAELLSEGSLAPSGCRSLHRHAQAQQAF